MLSAELPGVCAQEESAKPPPRGLGKAWEALPGAEAHCPQGESSLESVQSWPCPQHPSAGYGEEQPCLSGSPLHVQMAHYHGLGSGGAPPLRGVHSGPMKLVAGAAEG